MQNPIQPVLLFWSNLLQRVPTSLPASHSLSAGAHVGERETERAGGTAEGREKERGRGREGGRERKSQRLLKKYFNVLLTRHSTAWQECPYVLIGGPDADKINTIPIS